MNTCKVCSSKTYEEKIEVRTTSADDNICEKIKQDGCNKCSGCSDDNNNFLILIHHNLMQLEYNHIIGDSIINPISECRRIKYCFECGRKL